MPFPLAHPAAVLPLRRFCPRPLCFPALVIGSVTPDAGYLFGRLNVADFSHRLIGSLAFDLPAGLLMVLLFYRWRLPLVERLPQRYREVFRPLCQQAAGPLLVVALSVLLGTWSHLLWDGLTHKEGWFVEHWPVLQASLLAVGYHHIRVCQVVWYVTSFLGVAALYAAYQRWRQTPAGGAWPGSSGVLVRNAVFMALLVFPLEALHHLFHHPLQAYTVGALTLAFVAVAVWRLDRTSPSS